MTNAQRMNELYEVLSRGCEWNKYFVPPRVAEKVTEPVKRASPQALRPQRFEVPVRDIIANHLKGKGAQTAIEIAKATGVKYQTVRCTLYDMRVAGDVQPIGPCKTRKWRMVA